MRLNDLAKRCYDDAVELGWYGPRKTELESLMMIVTELAEVVEEFRGPIARSHYAKPNSIRPEGYGPELADVLIRTLDLCQSLGLNMEQLVEEKLTYNKTRGYRHGNKKF